jgi:hypothetical protein
MQKRDFAARVARASPMLPRVVAGQPSLIRRRSISSLYRAISTALRRSLALVFDNQNLLFARPRLSPMARSSVYS